MNAIDLGLSVQWADCNIGANKPNECGNYYSWGEIMPKNIYDWDTYKWLFTEKNKLYLIKYSKKRKCNTVDNKITLDPEDDIAYINWKGTYRIPTNEEWAELRNNCKWTWTNNYNNTDVKGRIIISKINGNHIFLPASGYRFESNLRDIVDFGLYWSSSLYINDPYYAWFAYFNSISIYKEQSFFNRYYGLSIRPVFNK